ncbi:diguanylate cyclase [Aquibacillus koreensis]|uniref:Diguanylate cyclase n=1 Tax=Aquibacillus koreensis TaxID=279446 RepID=A0A9X3WPL4_9BACI|nr:diguanylate cyclase [Aquibacillus koreensis]MCT2535383.1 diguanylate cyclase [Aquibacillus koreensis]MDC3422548.1 diguanylate cyclase [Aquibacillus koreensis]
MTLQQWKNPTNIYLLIISLTGCILFVLQGISFQAFNMNEWLMFGMLVCSIILLNEYMIWLPPKGNSLSMDSAIYVATIFVFGLEIAFYVLVASSIIFALYHRKIAWWKHLFNFSIYSIMITGSFYVYTFSGGEVGAFNLDQLFSYAFTMFMYFAINVILIGLFFILSSDEKLLQGMIKDALSSYFITLVLALILGILFEAYPLFGLLIFSIITILISLVFKQYFHLYEILEEKANRDDLTGLINHGYFKELLGKQFDDKAMHPLSLCILDIDDFKKFNDYHGHLKGDHLLRRIGTILKDSCEKNKFTAARYGGEEFVILMPNTSKEEAFLFIDKLRKTLNDTYIPGVEVLPQGCISFSGGLMELGKTVYSTSEFLTKADQALYYAKAQGKNMVHIYNSEESMQHVLDVRKETELLEQKLSIFLFKDIDTYKHSKRVYKYAIHFAAKLTLSEREKKLLIMGALIHDIGKLEIPRDIINKTGRLDPYEWEMMKKHVTWGKEIISVHKDLEELIPLIELHHERLDGKGYPYGLKGKSIPKLARILCIIDSFDAMTTERPYQKTKSFDEAIEELKRCAGKQFDATYVGLFIEMIKEKYPLKLKQ